MQVFHHTALYRQLGQGLFAVLAVIGQKVFVDGAGSRINATVLLGCVKQLLAGGKVFGFSLVFVGLHLGLQVGVLFRKDRYLACLFLQLVHQAEHIRITRAVLEARAFLYVFQIHVFSVFLWLNEPVIE